MRSLIGKLIIPLSVLISIGLIKWINPWENLFDTPSSAYLPYNLARLLFFLVLPILVFSAGRLVFPARSFFLSVKNFDQLDHFIFCSAAGAALLSILHFLLAALNCLYTGIIVGIAFSLSILAYWRTGEFSENWRNRGKAFYAFVDAPRGWWLSLRLLPALLLLAAAFIAVDIYQVRGITATLVHTFIGWVRSGFIIAPLSVLAVLLACNRKRIIGWFRDSQKTIALIKESIGGWWRPEYLISLFCLFFLVIIAGDVLIKRGLVPHLLGNDVPGTYLPYYEDVVFENHGFWPTTWLINYYNGKGAGLQFFGVAITDIFSCQLVNLYLFALAALALVQSLRKLDIPPVWISICLLFFLRSDLILGSQAKNHTALAAYIILVFFLCADLMRIQDRLRWVLARPLFLISVSVVWFLPISVMFCFSLLLTSILLALLLKRYSAIGLYVTSSLILAGSFLAVYLFNYWQSGLFDFATSMLDKYINVSTFSSWSSELILQMQRYFNQQEGFFSFLGLFEWSRLTAMLASLDGISVFDLLGCLPSLILIISVCLMLINLRGHKLKDLLQRTREDSKFIIVILALGVLAICAAARLVYVHDALQQATSFSSFFFLLCLFGSLRLAYPRPAGKHFKVAARIAMPLMVLVIAYAGIISNNYSFFLQTSAHKHWQNFLVGLADYKAIINDRWPIDAEWHVQKNIIPGEKIICLNFMPGAWLLPRGKYLRPLQNEFMKDAQAIYYNSPEESLALLQKYNIRYVMIKVDQHLMFNALAPIFRPASLIKHARLIWRGGPGRACYLLSLTGEVGEKLTDNHNFITLYKASKVSKNHYELYQFGLRFNNKTTDGFTQ